MKYLFNSLGKELSSFGYLEDAEKYFNIYKDEFIKIFNDIKSENKDIPNYSEFIEFKLIKDSNIMGPSTPADCYFHIGKFEVEVRFNLITLDRRYNFSDYRIFNSKELFTRYLGCHEAIHVCTKVLDEKLADENYGHGEFFKKYMNKYRSRYTKIPFWTDGIHSNFSQKIFLGRAHFPELGVGFKKRLEDLK